MATDVSPSCLSLPAAADLSAAQYKCVGVNSSGQAVLASAAGQIVAGILQDKPGAAGRVGQVAWQGVSKALVGAGGVTAGTYVKSNADGTVGAAVLANGAGITGSNVVGLCLKTAASGEITSVLVLLSGAVPTTAA